MTRVYLDHNATTPLHPAARAAMARWLDDEFGNPSSIHAEGRAARHAVEEARRQVAGLIGARADEIVFVAGGTEADHLAIRGGAHAARKLDPRRKVVVTTAIEHPAVLGATAALADEGFEVRVCPVDGEGRLDFAGRIDDTVALVSVQTANHELGTLLPIAAVAERARGCGVWLHTDAVQAAGKCALDVAALGVDFLSLSAHKLGGPKGVGALYVRRGRTPSPLFGGHQERGQRGGTENVIGIVGFAAAAQRLVMDGAVASLRDRLEAGAVALGARVNGGAVARVGNTSNVAFDGVEGELLVGALDLAGVAASTGAACTSGSVEPSPVLLALGQSAARAKEAVRFSLGPSNTEGEIDRVLALLPSLLARIRSATENSG